MTLRALTFTTVCLILLVHLASGWNQGSRRWQYWQNTQKPTPVLEERAIVTYGSDEWRSKWPIAPYPPPVSGKDDLQNRIVFGTDTEVHKHPYQLALEGGGSHICGGSILSVDWALTAAHCVYNQPLKWLTFRAGSTQRERGGTVHRIKYYVTHESYRAKTLDYDVAVVRVNDPFYYNERTLPITLPTREYYDGEKVVVTGWGYKQKTLLTKSRNLQMAALLTLDWKKCDKLYPGQITDTMMCAGDIRNKSDICSGDSGGPLVMARSRVQVGIVSWSHACADGKPSVYVDVFSVATWIRQKVGFDDQIFFENK